MHCEYYFFSALCNKVQMADSELLVTKNYFDIRSDSKSEVSVKMPFSAVNKISIN